MDFKDSEKFQILKKIWGSAFEGETQTFDYSTLLNGEAVASKLKADLAQYRKHIRIHKLKNGYNAEWGQIFVCTLVRTSKNCVKVSKLPDFLIERKLKIISTRPTYGK